MVDAAAVLTPYAQSLGMRVARMEGDVPVLAVDFSGAVEGRPGALHGGAISGLLETAGYALLRGELARLDRVARMKPINITVQFLAAGTVQETYASARIVKLGRRTANISVEAWQDKRDRPIASAVMNVMVASEA